MDIPHGFFDTNQPVNIPKKPKMYHKKKRNHKKNHGKQTTECNEGNNVTKRDHEGNQQELFTPQAKKQQISQHQGTARATAGKDQGKQNIVGQPFP